ncbi:uncharacterized protein LOC128866884 [Anastrepha ludens]|uniref:uncharacterized protein LOC128866884 n=1 Tax=Anastrepha ludens TaxID=28586 RepID=UPI0023B16729|nr:uncharacterized protein LOC128866884 [Anastrepha ludens]
MNRRSLRNRIFDENELESESSELETSSEYEENDDERSERSSDNSLESDSSDIEPLSQEILEGSAVNLDIRMNSKNGLIEYTKEPFVRGRRFSFRHQSNVSKGPTAFAISAVESPLSAFVLILSPIEEHILRMTNLFGARTYRNNWEHLTIQQLRAYFGLLLLAGVYRSYGECVTQVWNVDKGRAIFRKTMSLDMFKKIQRCIRFDDREERNRRDKLSPIRFFCNMLDISALNAYIIFTHIFSDWNRKKTNINIRRRLFLEELGEALTVPFATNRSHPPRMSQQFHAELHPQTSMSHLQPNNKRGRCYICSSKNNRNVFASRCEKCARFICASHKYSICHNCACRIVSN